MHSPQSNPGQPSPRTLIVSQRELSQDLARACPYTFEDLVMEVEPAARIDLGSVNKSRPWLQSLGGIVRRRLNLVVHLDQRLERYELDRDYELLFFHCQSESDLHRIHRIKNWRKRCAKAVVWLDDIWPSDFEKYRELLEPLEAFDHCFVGLADSARAITSCLNCPTTFIPPGVHASLFNPYKLQLPRSVDFYWMGRKVESTHGSLQRFAEDCKRVYQYDTVEARRFLNHVDHRRMTARLINASQYFIVHRSRVNDSAGRTGNYEGFGFRYFEGAAGGAVMLGGAPDTEEFRKAFDWPDVVLPLDGSYEQLEHTVRSLEADPDRLRQIRVNNVVGCLRQHDWSYRWGAILEAVGVNPDPALEAWQEGLEREAVEALGRV